MKEMRWEADRWRRRSRVEGGRASKWPGDIYRSRTLQQIPTWTKNTQRGWLCMNMKYGHSAGVQSRRCWLPLLLPKPLRIPSASHHTPFPSQPLREGCHPMTYTDWNPPEFNELFFHQPKQQKVFWGKFSTYHSREDEFCYHLVKYFAMKNSVLKHVPLPLMLPNNLQ